MISIFVADKAAVQKADVQTFSRKNIVKREVPFSRWVFPGGEVGVKLLAHEYPNPADEVYFIHCMYPDSEEIMELLMFADAMRRLVSSVEIVLSIPYFPYARQDRACNTGESYSLAVFSQWIAFNFDLVITYDIHSDVTSRHFLRGQFVNFDPISLLVDEIIEANFPGTVLVFPDDGARKRYVKDQYLHKCVALPKTRTNGKVVYDRNSLSKEDEKKLSEAVEVIVLDDICDGGATFISLAQTFFDVLKPDTNKILFVTHGIFSKGKDELLKYYNVVDCFLAKPKE